MGGGESVTMQQERCSFCEAIPSVFQLKALRRRVRKYAIGVALSAVRTRNIIFFLCQCRLIINVSTKKLKASSTGSQPNLRLSFLNVRRIKLEYEIFSRISVCVCMYLAVV